MEDVNCPTKDEFNTNVHQYINNSDLNNANSNLACFLTIVSSHIDVYIEDDHQLSKYAWTFLKSNLYNANPTFCLSKFLSIVSIASLEFKIKKLILMILCLNLRLKPVSVDVLRDFNFFKILLQLIDSNLENFELMKILNEILFQYLNKSDCLSDEEFNEINDGHLDHLVNSIKFFYSNNNDEEKDLTYCKFKVLLCLNEQFLIKFYTNPSFDNRVFKNIINNKDEHFTEPIIYYFNRENDNTIKILILKFLYLIFTTSYTIEFFYLNDLKVLVDIFLRELNNLTVLDQENLINIYLKVFYPLLYFSQLKVEEYKKNEIKTLLVNLSATNSETVNKSSKRCLAIDWIAVEDECVMDPGTPISLSSNNSFDSFALQTRVTLIIPNEADKFSIDSNSPPTPNESLEGDPPIIAVDYVANNYEKSTIRERPSKMNLNKKLPPPPPPPPRRLKSNNNLLR